MRSFVAVDVETANVRRGSICQIGIVEFEGTQIAKEWVSLVDPEDFFDPFNIGIHGISEDAVAGAPNLAKVAPVLTEIMTGKAILHHGPFDRTAFDQAFSATAINPIECDWIDNTKVVRRTWEQFRTAGYNLRNLCDHFGIELDHHDALSDARAAGLVFLRAIEETGTDVRHWISEQNRRTHRPSAHTTREGAEDGPFFGQSIVFTGSLTIPRSKAASLAAKLGFDVKGSVSKKTTHLCVGIPDQDRFGGYEKSSKHRKAEELANNGQGIDFLTEDDFLALISSHEADVQE